MENLKEQYTGIDDIRRTAAALRREVTDSRRINHPDYVAFFACIKMLDTEASQLTALLHDYEKLAADLRYTDMQSMIPTITQHQIELCLLMKELQDAGSRILEKAPELTLGTYLSSFVASVVVGIVPACFAGWLVDWSLLVDDGHAYVINTPFLLLFVMCCAGFPAAWHLVSKMEHSNSVKKWTRS